MQPGAGDRGFRRRRQVRVLYPHVPAGSAPVAADPDGQEGGPSGERRVEQPADPSVARRALGTASVAVGVVVDDFALDDRTGRGDLIARGGQT